MVGIRPLLIPKWSLHGGLKRFDYTRSRSCILSINRTEAALHYIINLIIRLTSSRQIWSWIRILFRNLFACSTFESYRYYVTDMRLIWCVCDVRAPHIASSSLFSWTRSSTLRDAAQFIPRSWPRFDASIIFSYWSLTVQKLRASFHWSDEYVTLAAAEGHAVMPWPSTTWGQ